MSATSSALECTIGRRASARTACDLVVEIRDGSACWTRALLKDFSATGFRLLRVSETVTGNSLWLRAEGLEPIAAKIRWRADGAAGCQFLYRLDELTETLLKDITHRGRADLASSRAGGGWGQAPGTLLSVPEHA